MNCSPEKASALIFSNVLREIFLTGNSSVKIVLTKTGLSQIFVDPIKEILHKNNNEIKTSEKLENIFIEKSRVKKILTNKNVYENFDDIIIAIPPYAISKLNFIDENGKTFSPLSKILADDFKYSSILNIHLWLSENIFQEKFYGLLNSEIHWIFNHGKHISITKSNADLISDMNKDQILEIVYSELKNYFPIFSVEKVVDVKIIKEKRATFVPDVASNVLRKKIISEFDNLHFIGDWTTKEFPSTIEGAILSGKNIIDSI
jgi:zeta-carotene desaturase